MDIAVVKLAPEFTESQQNQIAESFGTDLDFVFDSAFGSDFGSAFDIALRIWISELQCGFENQHFSEDLQQ